MWELVLHVYIRTIEDVSLHFALLVGGLHGLYAHRSEHVLAFNQLFFGSIKFTRSSRVVLEVEMTVVWTNQLASFLLFIYVLSLRSLQPHHILKISVWNLIDNRNLWLMVSLDSLDAHESTCY